jgi:hypothetical protein
MVIAVRSPNWMISATNPLIEIEIGITRRGKYTLPKSAAFLENTSELLIRHIEK